MLILLLLLQATQDVDVRPHALFADHLVLQSDVPAPVWGTAAPGRKIDVAIGGQRKSAVADKDGRWKVVLDPLKAGGPFELRVAGLTFRNVMAGEVWLCSGQSNMGWSVRLSANPAEEIAAAKHPKIRFFTVKRRMSETPRTDV